MCGILGVYVNQECESIFANLKKLYINQKHRGTFGCGFCLYNKDSFIRKRGRNSDYLFSSTYFYTTLKHLKKGDKVIMHHRYGTSGGNGNVYEANHPFINEKGNIALIHNGVLSDYKKHYQRLLKLGHNFESEISLKTKKNIIVGRDITDSEIILHEIESDNVLNSIDNIKKIEGSMAIAFLVKGKNKIYLFTRSNPIVVSKDRKDNYYFSSLFCSCDGNLSFVETLDDNVLFSIDELGLNSEKIVERTESYKVDSYKDTKQKDLYDFEDYNDYLNQKGKNRRFFQGLKE